MEGGNLLFSHEFLRRCVMHTWVQYLH